MLKKNKKTRKTRLVDLFFALKLNNKQRHATNKATEILFFIFPYISHQSECCVVSTLYQKYKKKLKTMKNESHGRKKEKTVVVEDGEEEKNEKILTKDT